MYNAQYHHIPIYSYYLLLSIDNDKNNDTNNNNNDYCLYNKTRKKYDGVLLLEPDEFDDYLTSPNDPNVDIPQYDETIHDYTQLWNSTNTVELVLEVEGNRKEMKGVKRDITISGHTLLNQCGVLLMREKRLIKGNKSQKLFIQKICTISCGNSVPLMYP